MKQYLIALLTIFSLVSCDCMQHASGVVLDKETKIPLNTVAIGKYELEDAKIPYSRKEFTDTTGQFEYSSISGGPFGCPGLKLYFSKDGYKTKKISLDCSSNNDTILLEKIK